MNQRAQASRFIAMLGFLLAFLPTLVRAQVGDTPTITRPVNDRVGTLSLTTVQEMEKALSNHRAQTGTQLAALIISSTNGEPIEDYAHRVATAWGGGEKGKDNGALLVLAMSDRRSRLEVGYGLEQSLSDGVAKSILDSMRTDLKAGDYDRAVATALKQMIERTGGDGNALGMPSPRGPSATASAGDSSGGTGVLLGVLFMFVGLGVVMRFVLRGGSLGSGSTNYSHSGYSDSSSTSSWSSSDSSSSSSSDFSSSSSSSDYSGGGGDYGGGGASSSW